MKPGVLVFIGLAALAPLLQATDQLFYLGLASRILIYALAASSLNLVLGYGGMLSFGHAAFFGGGAYVVAILAAEGVTSAWISWPAAAAASALAALAIGAISLRTRGVYFIMITLAFAQMIYYVFVSLRAYGGEDGMPLGARSAMGGGIAVLCWANRAFGSVAVNGCLPASISYMMTPSA
jgi:branched-chain amino acid transport system permease protein